MTPELADVDVTIKHETKQAWLVHSHETDKEAWVPKSVGEFEPSNTSGVKGVLTIPENMAVDKELV